eukprot:gene11898-12042_t
MTDERRRPLAKRLARAVSEFSYQYDEKASSLGFLVQLWLPTETGVLTTKGSPFAISGCSETLALYKHESSKYTPTTDGANAACPVSRVFADLQPELADSSDTGSWHYKHQKQMHFDRVAEAQRAGIHSTLVLPVYDSQTLAGDSSAQSSDSSTSRHPVAVLELNQHEADVDFTEAVSLLSSICQGMLGMQVPAAAGTGTAAATDAPNPAWSAQQPQQRLDFPSCHTDVQAAGAGGGMLVDRVHSNHSSALLRTSTMEHSIPSILSSTLSAEQAAKIHLGRLVGAGSFGRVFRGMLDGQEVAVKVLHHSKSSSKQISREVEMMMQLDHPNLVKAWHFIIWGTAGASQGLVGSGEWGSSSGVPPEQYVPLMTQSSLDEVRDADQNTQRSNSNESLEPQPSVTETWILSEFCNAGTLQDSVHRRNDGPFFNNDVPQMYPILLVLLGVAQGMEWLHSQGILHSDLKASNVMLTVVPAGAEAGAQDESTASRMAALTAATAAVARGSFSLELPSAGCELVSKVTDFGLSRLLRAGSSHLSTFTVGTLTHQAPEVMRNGRLSKPADVFSFGVLMWEVITATVPWYGMMMGEIMNAIMIQGRRLHYGPLVPKGYRELSQSCWVDDPKERPTFTSIVSQLQAMMDEAQDMQAEAQASSAEISGWWSE